MPTVMITVAGTEAPKPGKVRGRIKDGAGMLYQANPDVINSVRVGSTYDLTYKDETFNHVSYRVVENVAPSMGQPAQPLPRAYPSQGQATSRQQTYAPPEDERGLDIATLAIAKVWLEKVQPGDQAGCVHALRVARRAWKQFKANPDNIESGRATPERYEEFPEQ